MLNYRLMLSLAGVGLAAGCGEVTTKFDDAALADAALVDAPLVDAPLVDASVDAALDAALPVDLTVRRLGTGAGLVTSLPSGIDCGTTCTASFPQGSQVTLTATATSGTFTGWDGGGCSGTSPCTVTLAAATTVSATFVAPTTFLINQINSSAQHVWDPVTNQLTRLHSTQANDVDCNAAEGSAAAWWANHFVDHIGTFTYGAGTGVVLDVLVPYAYPKHVTVFNNAVVVMSRNDATLKRYDLTGAEIQSVASGNGVGQGLATNGDDLYASYWNGTSSFFVRYDATLTPVGAVIPNPTGLTGNNLVDFAYDPGTGRYFGLATTGEGGTGTQTSTVVEFVMGGAVVQTYTLAVTADGIGQNGCP